MNFNFTVFCILGFVAMASCQLHYPREKLGGHRRRGPGKNKGPHHDGGSRRKQPAVQQKHGYVEVIDVNYNNGGYYDAHHYWKVDCNPLGEYPHKYITGIWDDRNNFSDLDKVKCDSQGDGITLELEEYIDVISLDKKHGHDDVYAGQCKPGYVLTAIYDKAFGFPSPSLAKCNKILYGEIDTGNIQSKYTNDKDGGPYGPYDHWFVQCPEHYAAVGLEKVHGKIKTLSCAYIVPHHV